MSEPDQYHNCQLQFQSFSLVSRSRSWVCISSAVMCSVQQCFQQERWSNIVIFVLSHCTNIHRRWILAWQMSQTTVPIRSSQLLWDWCSCFAAHRATIGAGTRTAELSWWPILPFLFFFPMSNQQDRIRALEIATDCKLGWDYLCSHLMFPPPLGKIFVQIWTVNHHTAVLDWICILSSSFFSWKLTCLLVRFSAVCFILIDMWCLAFSSMYHCKKTNWRRRAESEWHHPFDAYDAFFFHSFVSAWNSEEFNFSWMLQLCSNNYF